MDQGRGHAGSGRGFRVLPNGVVMLGWGVASLSAAQGRGQFGLGRGF